MNILGLISQLIGIKTLRLTVSIPTRYPVRVRWGFCRTGASLMLNKKLTIFVVEESVRFFLYTSICRITSPKYKKTQVHQLSRPLKKTHIPNQQKNKEKEKIPNRETEYEKWKVMEIIPNQFLKNTILCFLVFVF